MADVDRKTAGSGTHPRPDVTPASPPSKPFREFTLEEYLDHERAQGLGSAIR